MHVCIYQNVTVTADKQLVSVRRFNCSAICQQEILDTVAESNAAGVGIADSYFSQPHPPAPSHM
ncbi:hypothetical protein PF010_g29987 [Phytophthora fragariae]|uniref:Uncharacterized protein n=1 Tax=Phytophthora fragariae TaxID=53985 RepID=A0A6G0MBK9_9STRA|nr:hypothetical protein PF010_g29987 [Phytophthora fragariae]KAE9162183.1 hypothetical protein PF004_g30574 [Phytophthora fragariae]